MELFQLIFGLTAMTSIIFNFAVSETGYIQPEWRSNYESDYSFDGRNPRPLTSRDLLAWAFQIARGMEYLASRKVLFYDTRKIYIIQKHQRH